MEQGLGPTLRSTPQHGWPAVLASSCAAWCMPPPRLMAQPCSTASAAASIVPPAIVAMGRSTLRRSRKGGRKTSGTSSVTCAPGSGAGVGRWTGDPKCARVLQKQ